MPQRTRARTTGDGTPAPSPPTPTAASDAARTTQRPRRTASQTSSRGETPAQSTASQGAEQTTSLAHLSPDELARALRAMAAELESDSALADRISDAMREAPTPPAPPRTARRRTALASTAGQDAPEREAPKRPARTFRPRVIEGAAPDLGVGIPDPFMLRKRLGEAGLRRVLDDLRLGTLRAMVREHRLDPEGVAVHGNDAAKLRALILERTAAR